MVKDRHHGNHAVIQRHPDRKEKYESESFVTNRLLKTFPVFIRKQIGIFGILAGLFVKITPSVPGTSLYNYVEKKRGVYWGNNGRNFEE